MGVSVYSKAVELIHEADRMLGQIVWEYDAKEAAVHVSEEFLKTDKKGRPILPEGHERLYRSFDEANNKTLFDIYNPDIRDDPMFNGLNKFLKRIEWNVGFAYGTISDPNELEKTAEEIKTSKQRSYRTVNRLQKAWEKGLRHLVDSMVVLNSLYKMVPSGEVEVKSNASRTVQISFNRVTYNCAVTTEWKKFTFICTVSSIAASYQLFTIGGFGSIGSGVYLYAYQPEVVFEFTTEDYFNMLTGGGSSQGLYIYNNKLWLNGEYLKAKSISADKLNVTDLAAVSAAIGGWKIGSNYLYSTNDYIRLYANGRIRIGNVYLSSSSKELTVKYGMHVYNDPSQFSDGTGYIKFYNLYHVSSGGHLVFDKDGVTLAYLSSSSKRYKDHVGDMTVADAEKVLDIPVVWFRYKDGYLRHDDILVGKAIPGFYAEDVEKYFPVAAQKNEDGSVEDWNYRMLIPAMMKLIQELYKRTGGITK